MVCGPPVRSVKVIDGGVGEGTAAAPSIENVYGPLPLVGVMVIDPSLTPTQLADVLEVVLEIPAV
jgi:hypothetical protein